MKNNASKYLYRAAGQELCNVAVKMCKLRPLYKTLPIFHDCMCSEAFITSFNSAKTFTTDLKLDRNM